MYCSQYKTTLVSIKKSSKIGNLVICVYNTSPVYYEQKQRRKQTLQSDVYSDLPTCQLTNIVPCLIDQTEKFENRFSFWIDHVLNQNCDKTNKRSW